MTGRGVGRSVLFGRAPEETRLAPFEGETIQGAGFRKNGEAARGRLGVRKIVLLRCVSLTSGMGFITLRTAPLFRISLEPGLRIGYV